MNQWVSTGIWVRGYSQEPKWLKENCITKGHPIFCFLFVLLDSFLLVPSLHKNLLCLQTMINKRCTIVYDHWIGQHSPKPLLLLLPVICTLTAVPIAHVRAHTGMHTLHYSHISKTTLVQTRLKVPQPLQFPSCLLPLVLSYLQPPSLCFAFHAASERKKNLIISDLEAFNALPYYMSCPLPTCYSITREFGAWFACQR